MHDHPKILIALATYNEAENLPELLRRIHAETQRIAARFACGFDVLVVDDDSPDGTGTWCDAYAVENPWLVCIHRRSERGLGTAVIAAMRYAVENGYTRMINLDADLSHPPEAIHRLLGIAEDFFEDEPAQQQELPETADVVIGSRYVRGGRISGWSVVRHGMSRGVNLLTRILLGLKVRDASGAFRNYAVAALGELNTVEIVSRGYSFFEEILWRLKRGGASMAEVPIHFADRRVGASKLRWRECFRSLGVLLRLGWENWTRR